MVGSLIVLFAGGCALLISQINFNFDLGGRKHLDPIPVSHRACPYVRVMHSAADDFQQAYGEINPLVLLTTQPTGQVRPWPAEQARLEQSLNVLELAVVVGKGHFPGRIQQRLAVVVRSIRVGRMRVEHARNADRPLQRRLRQSLLDGSVRVRRRQRSRGQ